MKLAIPVESNNEDSLLNERFGRSLYFALYDKDTDTYEFVTNPAADARGGAGIEVVQYLASKDVTAVVAPHLGPNADNALKSADIEAFIVEKVSAKEIVEKWKNNQLKKV